MEKDLFGKGASLEIENIPPSCVKGGEKLSVCDVDGWMDGWID